MICMRAGFIQTHTRGAIHAARPQRHAPAKAAMTASAHELARALCPIFEAHACAHLVGEALPYRTAADAVVVAATAVLDGAGGDTDVVSRLRRTAHETALTKSEAIMAGAPAAAAILDAGLIMLSGLEEADPDEARYCMGAALVALADADVERNETQRAAGVAVLTRDAALVPLRAALKARLAH